MTGPLNRAFALAAIATLAACSANASSPIVPSTPSQPSSASQPSSVLQGRADIPGTAVPAVPGPWALERLCARPADPSERRCESIRRLDVAALKKPAVPYGYSPADLRAAYGLTALSLSSGVGQTVAIVDAYDDPKAESDLGVYRATYGIPACTTANGCFRKVNQNGLASPLPRKNAGWGGEESLDLDMVSAICPNCHILFVEASNAGSGLDAAVNTAARLGARYISN